ncbi:ATP-binding protein [Portibacter lacus]|uniref:Cell division control protein 48 CDC48 n=1 Tax=Portibacter lacus TaxID=1099794 RepID=A0AA37SLY8_9BACT|nr:ATP-binding protein [Portibacter lacus]GLR17048.1 cell division control protein 48 CDC48 [Portibacter lacus]
MKEEIDELLQAVKASPENTYIRLLLIRKIKDNKEYTELLSGQLNELLKHDPNNKEAKNLLAQHYYATNKLSACIILCEELQDKGQLSPKSKLVLAKAYFSEKDMAKAKEIYEEVLDYDPDLFDDELDDAFRMKLDYLEDEYTDSHFLQKPKMGFADVGGMAKVKKEIDLKIIKPLEHKELYAQYGKKVGGGLLLYGPPGCGKTFIAKATAGEIDANFINVSLNDILDMFIGNSEKNLHDIFEIARAHTPCVMFIDEIDALGAKRSDLRQSAGKNIINQFLAELDGLEANNDGILIIGATNTPWHLDSAFRRPGRFDRIIFVPPPDDESKIEILKLKLKEKPVEKIDYKAVIKHTKDYSGADIDAMIDIAIESKLEKAMETGIPEPISTKDLVAAAKNHKPSTVDWFTTAKNYALFANQSGLYNDILKYLK